MKLKYEMTILNINNSLIAVPVSSVDCNCVIEVNETAADILELLNEDVSEDYIIDVLENRYLASKTDIRQNVQKFTAALQQRNMLDNNQYLFNVRQSSLR